MISNPLVYVVALLHVGFLLLESIFWMTPTVRSIFRNKEKKAETTRVMAFNQGFYNLGLSFLLFYFLSNGNQDGINAILYYIAVMGVVGAISATKMILLVQTLPAIAAVIFMNK